MIIFVLCNMITFFFKEEVGKYARALTDLNSSLDNICFYDGRN